MTPEFVAGILMGTLALACLILQVAVIAVLRARKLGGNTIVDWCIGAVLSIVCLVVAGLCAFASYSLLSGLTEVAL